MTSVKMLWGPASVGSITVYSSAQSGQALNDADNAAAWSFCIPADGIITDVGIYLTAENGTSPAYNVGITTLDSSGRPTQTAYGGSAITSAQWTSTGWKWVTLSTPATAAAGDFAAVHVYPTASVPDGSNNISVLCNSVIVPSGDGCALSYTTGWLAQAGAPAMAIKYDTGVIRGLALASNTLNVNIRAGTTPDEAGCLFQVPAAMTVFGVRFYALSSGWGSAATAEVILYNSSGTALATATISDKDFVDDNNSVNVYFDAVNLSANTDYRIAIKPGVDTNGNVYTPVWTFESTAALAAVPEGSRWQYTSRADAGTWTNDNVSVCPMGLWVSDINFGNEYSYIG